MRKRKVRKTYPGNHLFFVFILTVLLSIAWSAHGQTPFPMATPPGGVPSPSSGGTLLGTPPTGGVAGVPAAGIPAMAGPSAGLSIPPSPNRPAELAGPPAQSVPAPATSTQPNSAVTPATVSPKTPPADSPIVIALLKAPAAGTSIITGTPLPLKDFLTGAGSSAMRYRHLCAYWSCAEKLAQYNIALLHANDVDSCINRYKGQPPASALPLLQSAQLLAAQRVKEAESEFVYTQFVFANQYLGGEQKLLRENYYKSTSEERQKILTSILVIPSDIPTSAPYNTRMDEIGKARSLSGIARTLGMTLPLQYEVVRNRIEESNQTYNNLLVLFRQQNASDEQILSALDRATQARYDMIEAVIEYNRMIAGYTSETVSNSVRGNTLLYTLNIFNETMRQEPLIKPVGYEAPLGTARQSGPNRTFMESTTVKRLVSDATETSHSESISPEQHLAIRELTVTLFPVQSKESGAGDSPIIEIPLTLRQAIGNINDSRTRLEVVECYWKLRAKIAELGIENGVLFSLQQMSNNFDRQLAPLGDRATPDLISLGGAFKAAVFGSLSRIAKMKIDIRYLQIELMQQIGQTTENGWPLPSSVPYCGPTYRLESDRASRTTFTLATESILIPEKLESAQAMGIRMGTPAELFRPNIAAISTPADGYLYLKTLDNKRQIAILFVSQIVSLNNSIARYVTDFSTSTIPNDDFVKSLIGTLN